MSVFRLTESGDLYRPSTATSFERVSGVDQCVQHLRTRLRLIAGEVFRDTRIGVRYFDVVMRPGVSTTAVANHIASVALGTPGIVDCQLSYDLEPIRGVVSVTADAQYLASDQRDRQPIHEVIQIRTAGSIQS